LKDQKNAAMQNIENIISLNPWWVDGKIPVHYKNCYRRKEFEIICALINEKNIISIHGIRGCGKTIILFQVIEHLLKNKIKSKNIIFFDLSVENLNLPEYLNRILPDDESEKEGKESTKYIFINECQYNPEIYNQIKKILFENPSLRFVLAFSNRAKPDSLNETIKSKIAFVKIDPLVFADYLNKNKILSKTLKMNISTLLDFDFFRMNEKTIKKEEKKLSEFLEEFLLRTGLNEFIDIHDDYSRKKMMLDRVVNKIIFKDFALSYDVRNVSLIEKLFNCLSSESSKISNLLQISKKHGISYPSLLQYMRYLEDYFLISSIKNYYFGNENEKKTNRKYFVSDFSFIQNQKYADLYKIKTMIYNHLSDYRNEGICKIYYWHHDRGSIDLLIDIKGTLIPLDIFYKDSFEKKEIRNMEKLLQREKYERGIIITKERLDFLRYDKYEIMLLPAWLLLLLKNEDIWQK
jgi:uncharacterized protein